MTERLSHELASLLAEDDRSSDRSIQRELLRARLVGNLSEGLGQVGQRDDRPTDHARVAAFLDGSLSGPEWEDVAVGLAADAATRSDMAATAAFLDEVDARSAALPAGLLARATDVLAAEAGGSRRPSVIGSTVSWYRRTMIWSVPAAAMLGTFAILGASLWDDLSLKLTDNSRPIERGLGVVPAKGKSGRMCDETAGQDAKGQRKPDISGADRSDSRLPAGSNRTGQVMPAEDDPCRPKPADRRTNEPAPVAGQN